MAREILEDAGFKKYLEAKINKEHYVFLCEDLEDRELFLKNDSMLVVSEKKKDDSTLNFAPQNIVGEETLILENPTLEEKVILSQSSFMESLGNLNAILSGREALVNQSKEQAIEALKSEISELEMTERKTKIAKQLLTKKHSLAEKLVMRKLYGEMLPTEEEARSLMENYSEEKEQEQKELCSLKKQTLSYLTGKLYENHLQKIYQDYGVFTAEEAFTGSLDLPGQEVVVNPELTQEKTVEIAPEGQKAESDSVTEVKEQKADVEVVIPSGSSESMVSQNVEAPAVPETSIPQVNPAPIPEPIPTDQSYEQMVNDIVNGSSSDQEENASTISETEVQDLLNPQPVSITPPLEQTPGVMDASATATVPSSLPQTVLEVPTSLGDYAMNSESTNIITEVSGKTR